MDKEDKKKYQEIQNRKSICIRLNLSESCILEEDMHREGWAAASSYVKSKLFGRHAEARFMQRIKRGKDEDLLISMRGTLQEMKNELELFNYRIEKHGVDKQYLRKFKQTSERLLEIAEEISRSNKYNKRKQVSI